MPANSTTPHEQRVAAASISPIRLVVCWHSVSGYMAACWRALAARPEVELHVLAGRANPSFKDEVVAGLNVHMIPEADLNKPDVMRALVRERRPDVIVGSGWFLKGVAALPFSEEFQHTPYAMAMDTPRQGSLRQRVGKIVHRKYFQRADRVIVPGERAFQLALDLGFPVSKIVRGLYGVDYAGLSTLVEKRASLPAGWPRKWLFMGRYHQSKGLDVLVPAYRAYRAMVEKPWGLTTLGSGELKAMLKGVEGIEDRGFVQPADQPGVLLEHGAFVLSSRYDPWPLVVVESCAAGLPVVCTEACGSAVELVRTCHNGVTCAPESAEALARAMAWLHERAEMLPEMGRRSAQLASAYSAQMWAERWVRMCQGMMRDREGAPQ